MEIVGEKEVGPRNPGGQRFKTTSSNEESSAATLKLLNYKPSTQSMRIIGLSMGAILWPTCRLCHNAGKISCENCDNKYECPIGSGKGVRNS